MDFLRACTTNVLAIDAFSTPFRLYQAVAREENASLKSPPRKPLADAVSFLRRRRVWATFRAQELLVFGDVTLEEEECFQGNVYFRRGASGVLDAAAFAQQPDLFTLFLEALGGVLSMRLAEETGALRCGSLMWLVPQVRDDAQKVCATVRLRLHFNASGTLLVSCEVGNVALEQLGEESVGGVKTVMAPYCEIAQIASGRSADDSHIDGKMRWRDERWKALVMEALEAEEITVDEDEDWIQLRVDSATTEVHGGDGTEVVIADKFLWPAKLCFTLHSSGCRKPHKQDLDWFTNRFKNPLADAQEWLLGAEAREKAAIEAQQDQQQAQSTQAPLAPETAPSELVISPPFIHRPDQQQMAGIYPTPPDGLVPASGPHVPSEPSCQTSQDAGLASDAIPTDTFSADAEARARGHSLVSSIGGYQGTADDLFGDLGDMEDFGNDEIGDADFSFFDEPDEPAGSERVIAEVEGDFDMLHTKSGVGVGVDPQEVSENNDRAVTDKQQKPSTSMGVAEDAKVGETPDALPHENTTGADPTEPGADGDGAPRAIEPQRPPLSPFGVRERLLPPPVPASVAKADPDRAAVVRRRSRFDPVAFNEGLDIDFKYRDGPFAAPPLPKVRNGPHTRPAVNIKLPPRTKKRRLTLPEPRPHADDVQMTESEEDSWTDPSSGSDEDLPPKMPWETRKRKRLAEVDALTPLTDSFERMMSDENAEDDDVDASSEEHLQGLLANIMSSKRRNALYELETMPHKALIERAEPEASDAGEDGAAATGVLTGMPDLDEVFDVSGQDLIGIAQLVAEQVMLRTSRPTSVVNLTRGDTEQRADKIDGSRLQNIVTDVVKRTMLTTTDCDIAKLALTVKTPERPGFPTKGQPRANLQRSETGGGPLIFAIPPPYVRITRAESHWEMLPPALSFWEALGLGPASGAKDVRWWCVTPSNNDLERLAEEFVQELGTAYEGCKLGSHVRGGDARPGDEEDNWPETMSAVEALGDTTLASVLEAYRSTCRDFGRALASVGHEDSARTIVVYIVNPFHDRDALQHICACFWEIYKSYKDPPKAHRNKPRSDLFLQILPVGIVASPGALVLRDAATMGALAREVYDRCPPSVPLEYSAPLPIEAAPAVELASAIPRKIHFQLAADPPGDLLYAGSVLHLAYSRSEDGLWVFAAWTDNTGRYQAWNAYSVHGRRLVDAFRDIWEMTEGVIAARQTAWRIFVASTHEVDVSERECWKRVTESYQQKGNVVALLSMPHDTFTNLFPCGQPVGIHGGIHGAGFLTPGSTPQAATFTASPDASGHSNLPPTPAPSEVNLENDPDTHLMDTTEETWGVLVEPSLFNTANEPGATLAAASGLLVRRGHGASEPEKPLPSLAVSLLWTLPEASPAAKRPEALLRDVLGLYRNLSLLTTLRGLGTTADAVLPWHIAAAARGAEALNGFV